MGPSKAITKAILVLNSGSSSLKYALYNMASSPACVAKGNVAAIGSSKCSITHTNLQVAQDMNLQGTAVADHKSALKRILELLHLEKEQSDRLYGVGHRVVHGGEHLTRPMVISEQVKKAIEQASPLAPLHNPPNLEGIRVAEELFHCPQVAVFDTAFHSSIPSYAYMYAVPYAVYKELGVRRYGFHGTSYQFLLDQAAMYLGQAKEEVNVIACHLGAGASMAAIQNGKCIDTTMGVTPLEGLVMATRCGDIDPAICNILASQRNLDADQINHLLNKESGLQGICGEKDMKGILEASEAGSQIHKLALDVYIHRIRKYLGAYFFHLQGNVDALIFSGGVGESSAKIRDMICAKLGAFGINIDDAKNHENKTTMRDIQKFDSKVKILVIPTDEELCIAEQTLGVLEEQKILQ
uniref:Probable acetate kinase n=1 Tax=Araucaria cunninghamii TaxID=56994 RepID=A0A0D6R510_ARACU